MPYIFFVCRLDLFLNLGCLTDSVTQIVELCSSYATLTDNFHLHHVRRMDREGLLHTASVRNASYGKGLGDSAAVLGDNGTLEHLDSLAGSLFDSVVDTDGITNIDRGDLGLQLLIRKSLK